MDLPTLFLSTKKFYVSNQIIEEKIISLTCLENIVIVLLPFKYLFKYFIIAFSLRPGHGHVCRYFYLIKVILLGVNPFESYLSSYLKFHLYR